VADAGSASWTSLLLVSPEQFKLAFLTTPEFTNRMTLTLT
jgi:hypothetical protein